MRGERVWMTAAFKRYRGLAIAVGLSGLIAVPALGGPYRDSAHGNSVYGVNRSAIDAKYFEYATGNCAHCHETHASIEGAEPAPETGASAHILFAGGFNTTRTVSPYYNSDNFCFYCHGSEAGPQVTNRDYSGTFGGAASGGPLSIMEAFNQSGSYHNLYDIWFFLSNNTAYSTWFAELGNPCSACHNSHLSKRNWDASLSGFPLLSAITRPGDHANLWGETQVMSAHSGYEAPFAFALSGEREPAGAGEAGGGNTPDYVGFCTTCHNPDNIIPSTTLNREIKKIDWGDLGVNRDKHGAHSRDGDNHFREPYVSAAAVKSNFLLSCLDCHESHGSENIMLLRRRINGENLEGTVSSTDAMSYACKRCHKDDLAATGTGQANRWEYVHHDAAGAPYAKSNCTDCHDTADGSTPVSCGNCHGHGMDDSWAGANKTGRKTF